MERMEKGEVSLNYPSIEDEEANIQKLISTLPRVKHWENLHHLCHYQGCWYVSKYFKGVIDFQTKFQAQDADIILATNPKCGTTWLKALTFSIVNRSQYPSDKSPLLTHNPHHLVPAAEVDIYGDKNHSPSVRRIPSQRRIVSTHVPFASLPNSIVNSNCRIVYICRHPLDQFVSLYHFIARQNKEIFPVDKAFDMFCDGVHAYGPYWEHILGYWKASVEQSGRILFLRYEDLKEDTKYWVKRLGEFLGFPFSEDGDDEIEGVVRLCSFEHLKGLEVNKSGERRPGVKSEIYFRKGQVGDRVNYLTPSQILRFEKLFNDKLLGSGLTFDKS